MGPIPPPPDARCPGGANPVDVQTIFTGSVEDFKICMQLEQRERTRSNDGIVTFMPDFRWLLPRSASYVASMMGECNLQMILFRHRRSPPSVSFCATVDAAANAPPTTTQHVTRLDSTRLDSSRLRCNHPRLCCNTSTHVAHAYFCHPTSPINWGGLTSTSYNVKTIAASRQKHRRVRLLETHPTHVDPSSSAKYEPRYSSLLVVPPRALHRRSCTKTLPTEIEFVARVSEKKIHRRRRRPTSPHTNRPTRYRYHTHSSLPFYFNPNPSNHGS